MNKEKELLQDIETLDRYLNWIGDFFEENFCTKKGGKKDGCLACPLCYPTEYPQLSLCKFKIFINPLGKLEESLGLEKKKNE